MEDFNSSLDYLNPYQDESEQMYQYFLRKAVDPYTNRTFGSTGYVPVDPDVGLTIPPWMYTNALNDVVNTRNSGRQDNPTLANVDHALQSQKDWDSFGPAVGLRPPAYQLLKLLAQKMPKASMIPAGLDALGRTTVGQKLLQTMDEHPFTEATPPSWQQLLWGMRPFWGRN